MTTVENNSLRSGQVSSDIGNKIEEYPQCYFPSFQRSYELAILGRDLECRGYHVLGNNLGVQVFESSCQGHRTPSLLEVECQIHDRHNK
jgi:hypothetical protein